MELKQVIKDYWSKTSEGISGNGKTALFIEGPRVLSYDEIEAMLQHEWTVCVASPDGVPNPRLISFSSLIKDRNDLLIYDFLIDTRDFIHGHFEQKYVCKTYASFLVSSEQFHSNMISINQQECYPVLSQIDLLDSACQMVIINYGGHKDRELCLEHCMKFGMRIIEENESKIVFAI
jgi:hypothetical protein